MIQISGFERGRSGSRLRVDEVKYIRYRACTFEVYAAQAHNYEVEYRLGRIGLRRTALLRAAQSDSRDGRASEDRRRPKESKSPSGIFDRSPSQRSTISESAPTRHRAGSGSRRFPEKSLRRRYTRSPGRSSRPPGCCGAGTAAAGCAAGDGQVRGSQDARSRPARMFEEMTEVKSTDVQRITLRLRPQQQKRQFSFAESRRT